jgi:hypothetical protein
MNALVTAQKQNLYGSATSSIVTARTKISKALRSFVTSAAPSAAVLAEVKAAVDYFSGGFVSLSRPVRALQMQRAGSSPPSTNAELESRKSFPLVGVGEVPAAPPQAGRITRLRAAAHAPGVRTWTVIAGRESSRKMRPRR